MKRGQSDFRLVCNYNAYPFCRSPERGMVNQWQGKTGVYLHYLESSRSLLSLNFSCYVGFISFLLRFSDSWESPTKDLVSECSVDLHVGTDDSNVSSSGILREYCNEWCLYENAFTRKALCLQPRKVFPPFHKNHLRSHTTNTQLAPPARLLTPPDTVCELKTYSNYSNTFTYVFKAPIFIHVFNLIFQ